MLEEVVKKVVTYERVSSEDQKERETIKTQTEALAQRLKTEPSVELFHRYVDDGVSGKIPMNERPSGKLLLEDAAKGLFSEVWVYRLDRLGRDVIDPLVVRRQLAALGVKVKSATENIESELEYELRVVLAAEERRTFLARSSAGMARAAREGRYCGGIVPYGYKVYGVKAKARLVPSGNIVWKDWTEADVVRHIYDRLAQHRWSCLKIALELNGLGVPTSYTKDERLVTKGKRKERTRGVWRASRIRNLVVNPVYRGELQYGRRTNRVEGREVISANVPSIVSEEIWHAAQETLTNNQIFPNKSDRIHLLRSVLRCGVCGMNYSGAFNKKTKVTWYRCNGWSPQRGRIEGKCPSKAIKGDYVEPPIWSDIERFLRNPGEILEELRKEREMDNSGALAEAERISLEDALREIAQERKTAIHIRTRGTITDEELDELLSGITGRHNSIQERLDELLQSMDDEEVIVDEDMLEEIRSRLDAGLDDARKQEIIRLLVRQITVYTEIAGGKKTAKVVAEYRFPPHVAQVYTGIREERCYTVRRVIELPSGRKSKAA